MSSWKQQAEIWQLIYIVDIFKVSKSYSLLAAASPPVRICKQTSDLTTSPWFVKLMTSIFIINRLNTQVTWKHTVFIRWINCPLQYIYSEYLRTFYCSKTWANVEWASAAIHICLCSPPLSCRDTLWRWRAVGAEAPIIRSSLCFFKELGLIRWQPEFMEPIFHGAVIHGGFGAAKQLNGCSERLAWVVPWYD